MIDSYLLLIDPDYYPIVLFQHYDNQMKSKQLLTKPSPTLLIFNNDYEQSKATSKMLRRVKRAIKTVDTSSTPRFFDQNHIKDQLKEWQQKIASKRIIQGKQKTKVSRLHTIGASSQRLYHIYNEMRNDQKMVKSFLPQTYSLLISSPSQNNIQNNRPCNNINQTHHSKIKIANCFKRVLSPKHFEPEIMSFNDPHPGYKPMRSRLQKQLETNRSNNLGSFKTSEKKYVGQKKQLLSLQSYQKMLSKSPTAVLSRGRGESSYGQKSRVKKIWSTIGLHDWSNIG